MDIKRHRIGEPKQKIEDLGEGQVFMFASEYEKDGEDADIYIKTDEEAWIAVCIKSGTLIEAKTDAPVFTVKGFFSLQEIEINL